MTKLKTLAVSAFTAALATGFSAHEARAQSSAAVVGGAVAATQTVFDSGSLGSKTITVTIENPAPACTAEQEAERATALISSDRTVADISALRAKCESRRAPLGLADTGMGASLGHLDACRTEAKAANNGAASALAGEEVARCINEKSSNNAPLPACTPEQTNGMLRLLADPKATAGKLNEASGFCDYKGFPSFKNEFIAACQQTVPRGGTPEARGAGIAGCTQAMAAEAQKKEEQGNSPISYVLAGMIALGTISVIGKTLTAKYPG